MVKRRPAFHAAEMVVNLFAAVKRNADVGKADFLELSGHGTVDEGTVGGDDGAHALRGGVAGQFGHVLADGGFAAGEEHDRRAVGGEVVNHDLGLLGGNGVDALVGFGLGIAVRAFEVAAARHVPYDHRLLVGGELEKVGRQLAGMAAVTQGVGRFHLSAVELGNTNHVRSSLGVYGKSGARTVRSAAILNGKSCPPFQSGGRQGSIIAAQAFRIK